jgi:hypothetical protein
MSLWYRVFGRGEIEVSAANLQTYLSGQTVLVTCQFAEDARGWVRADIRFATSSPLHLERYRSDEEGIRGELNSWAAFLETCDYEPKYVELMERVIQAKQLFTLRRPVDYSNEVLVESLCVGLCRFLASETDGVWQCDGEGFFAADGELLLKEY